MPAVGSAWGRRLALRPLHNLVIGSRAPKMCTRKFPAVKTEKWENCAGSGRQPGAGSPRGENFTIERHFYHTFQPKLKQARDSCIRLQLNCDLLRQFTATDTGQTESYGSSSTATLGA